MHDHVNLVNYVNQALTDRYGYSTLQVTRVNVFQIVFKLMKHFHSLS